MPVHRTKKPPPVKPSMHSAALGRADLLICLYRRVAVQRKHVTVLKRVETRARLGENRLALLEGPCHGVVYALR